MSGGGSLPEFVMGASRDRFRKYPRTPHLFGSAGTADDRHLDERDSRALLADPSLIVEEKVDGTNVGLHFQPAADADPDDAGRAPLVLQNRGHILGGGEHPQYGPLKAWCAAHEPALREVLGTRYVLFGEFLHARHTVAYDRLPGLLLEFDVLDKADGAFLPLAERRRFFDPLGLPTVPVLHAGPLDRKELAGLIGPSAYGARFVDPRTGRADDRMEGLYLRTEGGDPRRVTGRAKWVRPEFTAAVSASEHWRDRPIEPNRVTPGGGGWR